MYPLIFSPNMLFGLGEKILSASSEAAMLRILILVVAPFFAFEFAHADETRVSYDTEVRPIFKALCFQCHGEESRPKGKLDMRLVRLMAEGGRSGPAVVSGDLKESYLWERIKYDEMPEGPKKLTAEQKAIVKKWIEQGAKSDGPEPADPEAARFTRAEINFWAWQPPVQHPDPDASIDSFLLAKLKEKNVAGFSPRADKRTLIRRVTFDLTGLPPTLAEVDAYLKDDSPDAYAKVVDRLLTSQHYGERWARHWLDVAGYAETDGNPVGLDHPRPHAWKYRDYVVRSFNEDKPYDQFVREQLAGDELAPRPLNPSDPKTAELLTATGFLRMAPDPTASKMNDTLADRNQAAADTVRVAASAVLGLTMGCAQCHDHRYDPITHEEYHRFRAVFDPAFDLKNWQQPSERSVDATTLANKKRAKVIQGQADAQAKAIEKRENALAQKIYDEKLAAIPKNDRRAAAAAVEIDEDKQTEAQKALALKYPMLKPVGFIAGFLEEYDKQAFQSFEKEKEAVQKLRDTAPPADRLMIPAEEPDYSGTSRVFHRGDPLQPKQSVTPGEPFVLSQKRSPDIASNDPSLPTTGRRLALAHRLTDGSHPLTARVIVNRVWMHHFGRGIVNTPGDFGLNGELPTHPELLDHLAAGFVADGWSLKTLHRQILLTDAYQQQSKRIPVLDQLDPDNKLLGRMPIRRLEAEAMRDALLSVAGKLNPQVGGPSVPVTEDYLGRAVLGYREVSDFGKPYGELEYPSDADKSRRSLYVTAHRQMPLTMLDTFDLPVMVPNCDIRKSTTVPPQSLMFLNDANVVSHAEDLADRVWDECETTPDRVTRIFELLYAAKPSAEERKLCVKFVKRQEEHFRTHGDKDWLAQVKKYPASADSRALASLCQTLLASNRFLYVD